MCSLRALSVVPVAALVFACSSSPPARAASWRPRAECSSPRAARRVRSAAARRGASTRTRATCRAGRSTYSSAPVSVTCAVQAARERLLGERRRDARRAGLVRDQRHVRRLERTRSRTSGDVHVRRRLGPWTQNQCTVTFPDGGMGRARTRPGVHRLPGGVRRSAQHDVRRPGLLPLRELQPVGCASRAPT